MPKSDGEVRREAPVIPEWGEKGTTWVASYNGLTLVVQKKKHTGLYTKGSANGEAYVATVSGITVRTPKGAERSSPDLETTQEWAVDVAKVRPPLDPNLWSVVRDLRDGTSMVTTTPPSERLLTRSIMGRIADLIEQGKLGGG